MINLTSENLVSFIEIAFQNNILIFFSYCICILNFTGNINSFCKNISRCGKVRVLGDNSINTDERKSDGHSKFVSFLMRCFENRKAAGKYTRLVDPPSAPRGEIRRIKGQNKNEPEEQERRGKGRARYRRTLVFATLSPSTFHDAGNNLHEYIVCTRE